MVDATTELLATRQSTHGNFKDNAKITQDLMRVLMTGPRWKDMSDVHVEGIHMICHKLTRMVCGDPNEADHYDDCAGYAKLISKYINEQKTK